MKQVFAKLTCSNHFSQIPIRCRNQPHVHRLLQTLLGLPTPVYRHHPLLTDADGRRLAKRNGAPTLESLRLSGVDGPALADDLRRGVLPSGFLARIA